MSDGFSAKRTKFAQFYPISCILLIFCSWIVPVFAFCASKCYYRPIFFLCHLFLLFFNFFGLPFEAIRIYFDFSKLVLLRFQLRRTFSASLAKNGAQNGIRTRDLILTMDALCQLSYLGLFRNQESVNSNRIVLGNKALLFPCYWLHLLMACQVKPLEYTSILANSSYFAFSFEGQISIIYSEILSH